MDSATKISARLGRRLKSGSRRTRTVGTRVSSAEEQELIAAAERDGLNVSEWVRRVLFAAARKNQENALFTELVGTRMLLVNLLRPLALGEKVSPSWITEAMTMVRKEKHKAAQEVMQQYSQSSETE
jgi:hypothetical protein